MDTNMGEVTHVPAARNLGSQIDHYKWAARTWCLIGRQADAGESIGHNMREDFAAAPTIVL